MIKYYNMTWTKEMKIISLVRPCERSTFVPETIFRGIEQRVGRINLTESEKVLKSSN